MRMFLVGILLLGSLMTATADQNIPLITSGDIEFKQAYHDDIWLLQGIDHGDIVIQLGDLDDLTEKRITGLTGEIQTGPIRMIEDVVYSGYTTYEENFSLYIFKWDVELFTELIMESPNPIELFDIILLGTDIVYFLNVDLGYQIQSMMFYNNAFFKLQDLKLNELVYIENELFGVLGDVTHTSIIKINDQKAVTKVYEGSGFLIEQLFFNNRIQTFELTGTGYRIREWRVSEISLVPIGEFIIDIDGNLTIQLDFHLDTYHYLLAEHRVNVLGARIEDNYVDIRYSILELTNTSITEYQILVRDRDVIFSGYKDSLVSLLTYDTSTNEYLIEEYSLGNNSDFNFQIVGVIILTILWVGRKNLVRLIRK